MDRVGVEGRLGPTEMIGWKEPVRGVMQRMGDSGHLQSLDSGHPKSLDSGQWTPARLQIGHLQGQRDDN